MVNDEYKFIFVHVRKTGGTSLEQVFDSSAGHGKDEVPYKHYSAAELREMFPHKWDKYYTFSFVRNPWSWLVSRYKWSNGVHNYIESATFEQFVVELCQGNTSNIPQWIVKACEPQINMIGDSNRVIVDHVYRFEELQSGFDHICDVINHPKITLPHSTKTKHKHYTEYYNDKTRELVTCKYARDIETFGYIFGD